MNDSITVDGIKYSFSSAESCSMFLHFKHYTRNSYEYIRLFPSYTRRYFHPLELPGINIERYLRQNVIELRLFDGGYVYRYILDSAGWVYVIRE